MTSSPRRWVMAILLTAIGLIVALAGIAPGVAAAQRAPEQDVPVPVGGKIQAENACYVRLPDLPGARYGGFGALNADTGILAFVGGAEKRTSDNTIVYYDLWAMDLKDQNAHWNSILYNQNQGYTRETDRGCREMSNLMLGSPSSWLSVFGKDGCKGGGSSDGDLKELRVGASANAAGVSWVPNSGASGTLPQLLDEGSGKLARNFSAWDSSRNRAIIGQGTFNDEQDQATQDEVYQATKQGSKWNVKQLRPSGTVPTRRFGSCAAYVNDASQGLDGVLVLGGQQGGLSGTTSYKEVWWLDFAKSAQGEWRNITSRFANMDAFGYRREGACAYDEATKTFYSWMGRADGGIPDGAKRSAGAWRVSLQGLGDEQQSLTWERLAADNLAGINGRRLFPSIWDPNNRRMIIMGGRNDLDEYQDVWAIYPDVTGTECQDLEWSSVAPTPTAPPTNTPVPTTPATTGTPGMTPGTPSTVTPVTPPPGPQQPKQCEFINGRVPQAVINFALTNNAQIGGWGQLCFPSRPPSPFNGFREYLTLRNISKPYHPLYNGVVYRCGCP